MQILTYPIIIQIKEEILLDAFARLQADSIAREILAGILADNQTDAIVMGVITFRTCATVICLLGRNATLAYTQRPTVIPALCRLDTELHPAPLAVQN